MSSTQRLAFSGASLVRGDESRRLKYLLRHAFARRCLVSSVFCGVAPCRPALRWRKRCTAASHRRVATSSQKVSRSPKRIFFGVNRFEAMQQNLRVIHPPGCEITLRIAAGPLGCRQALCCLRLGGGEVSSCQLSESEILEVWDRTTAAAQHGLFAGKGGRMHS